MLFACSQLRLLRNRHFAVASLASPSMLGKSYFRATREPPAHSRLIRAISLNYLVRRGYQSRTSACRLVTGRQPGRETSQPYPIGWPKAHCAKRRRRTLSAPSRPSGLDALQGQDCRSATLRAEAGQTPACNERCPRWSKTTFVAPRKGPRKEAGPHGQGATWSFALPLFRATPKALPRRLPKGRQT